VVDGATTGLLDRLAAEGDRAVERVADRTAAAGVDLVGTAVVEGRPAVRIVDYAAARGVDLIVLGTHGRTGVDRYLLGSVAERVVRLAGVPVLVVPVPADGTDADAADGPDSAAG
jgi:nucleotide-binding universal stress UspA family protein